jgi:uncharacterized protein involved in response to NO
MAKRLTHNTVTQSLSLLGFSGALWSLAFAAFAIRLGPALFQRRANGRPG